MRMDEIRLIRKRFCMSVLSNSRTARSKYVQRVKPHFVQFHKHWHIKSQSSIKPRRKTGKTLSFPVTWKHYHRCDIPYVATCVTFHMLQQQSSGIDSHLVTSYWTPAVASLSILVGYCLQLLYGNYMYV